jgi:hypothetical protein
MDIKEISITTMYSAKNNTSNLKSILMEKAKERISNILILNKFIRFTGAIIIVLCVAVASQAATVTVAWDSTNATVNINKAIQLAGPNGTVILENHGAPWLVSNIRDGGEQTSAIYINKPGLTFIIKDGAKIKALHGGNHFMSKQAKLIHVAANGVTVKGEDEQWGNLEMNREEYSVSPYVVSQFRHGIMVGGFNNVTIKNLNIMQTGGDGILIGPYNNGNTSPSNVLVENVWGYQCTRMAVAITAGNGVTVKNCKFEGSVGEDPQSGIDIEADPNKPYAVLKNIVIENCTAINNTWSGFQIGLYHYYDKDGIEVEDVDITFRNCTSIGNGREGFRTNNTQSPHAGKGPGGTIKFQNCDIISSGWYGAFMGHYRVGDSPKISFEGCTFENVGTEGLKYNPVYWAYGTNGYKLGGTSFVPYNDEPTKIIDKNYDRAQLASGATGNGHQDITGTIYVDALSASFLDLGNNNIDISVTRVDYNSGVGASNIPSFGQPFNSSSLWLYPNPSNSTLTISWGDTRVRNISLLDLSGKTIKDFGDVEKIDISSLTPGMYMVKAEGSNTSETKMFIKQ